MKTNGIILTARGLSVWYGAFRALRDIELEIKRNTTTALIGPSGCRKSTLLRSFNRMNDLIPEFLWDLRWAAPILIGVTVGLEATFGGPISGASMNPARSFGPALVGLAWSHHWIYWVGPIVGAAGAAVLFALVCRAARGPFRSSNLAAD